MDKNYWERIAPSYDAEIFDVFANDTRQIVRSQLAKLGSPRKSVADIGCGIGKWLPTLSRHFGKVYAIDISKKNIDIARSQYGRLPNIEFICADIGQSKPVRCDVVLCVNALLTPSMKKREAFLRTLRSGVVKGGWLLLVTPALESALLSELILRYWHAKDGTRVPVYRAKDSSLKFNNLLQGVVDLDRVPTKHFLREELAFVLKQYDFAVEQTEKIEYPWDTEFTDPPSWLKEPYPWDWMCTAKKLK